MEQNEILEKIKRYLEEKLELTEETCYFITKRLNEDYWAIISSEDQGEDETEEESDDLFDDEEQPSQEEDLTEPEEVKKMAEPPKPPREMSTKPQIKTYQKRPSLLPKTG